MVVQCTWKAAEMRDVNDAISWTLADESPENDVEEEVQAENCLLLVAPQDTQSDFLAAPACQLIISCHPMQHIQYISVLSDARVIEVYGHHGEYLKTIKNELLEEVEDMAVFKGDIRLEKTLNVCSIKFACLRSKTEMWLYGVKVGIINVPKQETTPISFVEVERRLNEMGLPLSDKAKLFKELVESHPTLPGFNNPDLNAIINLFKTFTAIKEPLSNETVNNNQNIENENNANDFSNTNGAIKDESNEMINGAIKDESNEMINGAIKDETNGTVNDIVKDETNGTVNDAIKGEANKMINGANINNDNNNNIELTDSSTQTLDPPPPNLEDIIKLHIDHKVEELEKQLSEKLDKSFKEIETKLFCKLDEIESFVKPHGI